MTPGPRLSPATLAARDEVAAGREKLRRQHDSGSPGVQVCAHFTDLLEGIVVALYQEALHEQPPAVQERLGASVAVVAHSGFGRREMAPYSDIDVMLLHAANAKSEMTPFIRRFSQSLYDTGMDIGFAARTPAEACRLAIEDSTILTSLSEARPIAGAVELFAQFDGRFRRMVRRRRRGI